MVLHRDMQLNDLFPTKPEFFLSGTGKTYTIRIPNLEDRARFREWLGGDANVAKVFNELQWDVIAKLVYRLLEQKDEFLAFEETAVNDDGVKERRLITGPAVMMRAVKTIDEATNMLTALVTALRNGDPLIDKAMSVAFDEKKSQLNEASQTGPSSSTLSQVSTDTPQSSLAG